MIGVPDEKWGETIKALVVKAEGSALTEEELIDYVKGKVARYKAPSSVEFREALDSHRDRQAAEVQAARAVLGGPGPAGQLAPPSRFDPTAAMRRAYAPGMNLRRTAVGTVAALSLLASGVGIGVAVSAGAAEPSPVVVTRQSLARTRRHPARRSAPSASARSW